MEDRSDVRVRSLGRKRKLMLVIIVVGIGLALFLRLFSVFSPSFLPAFTSSISSFLGSATSLTIIVIVAFSVTLVTGRRRLVNCRLWRLFLPRTQTNMMIPSFGGDGGTLAINSNVKKDGEGFTISMLRLLSVPRAGVRQRVRGAVARDEQEEGAAVSDEKQYQFSHLESLSRSEERAGRVAYELQFRRGLVYVGFTVSAEDGADCRRRMEQVKANVLTKFPVQLVEAGGEHLKDAALMNLPLGVFQVEAIGDRVARISGRGFSSYAAVVALRGRPEMAAHEQRCQIDQLITGVNSAVKYRYQSSEKEQLDIDLIVSFESAKPPKYPSDASLREKLREKPEVKLSLERKKVEVDAMEVEFGHRTGWWRVSPYAVILGRDRAQVEEKAESVANVARSVWSGSHFSPDCRFLHGKEIVKYFPSIVRRALLPRRYVTEMSSVRLSSLVHIPEEAHPPLTKVTPPPFEAPDPAAASASDAGCGVVMLGDVLSPVGGTLYPLTLPVRALGTHMSVFGEAGFGKTCCILNLLWGLLREGGGEDAVGNYGFGGCVPFLVLDQKGEYRCLISKPKNGIAYFLPASDTAPLRINLFDPQGDDPDSHASRIFNIIREILFTNRTELTPQMERVLYDVLRMSVGGDWASFNNNLGEYLKVHGEELPQLGATIQGILNRVGQFTRPPLSHVFDCKESNMNFSYLVERCAIVDLSELRRLGTPEDVRLIANIIGKYVSVASLNRGADFSGELKHLFVVDDALDVVPEVLMKRTTADVGTIEYMAMLLRATGQGLIVVSQRPNIAENVIGNSAVKVFFRTVVDSRDVASWVNLSEEQAAYLKVLPKQEAVVTVPLHSAPVRIRVPDVSNIVSRKVANHDIIVNNMINYPLMYDMQRAEEEEARTAWTNRKKQNREKENEETEGAIENCEGVGKDGQTEKQEQRVTVEKADISKLALADREAWSQVRDYLVRGLALDSDFVSKMLGVSQPVAHRTMLTLKSAGLLVVAKVPNYAYGEGYQYVYYSPSKSLYGCGVVGYVRERIYDDLVGKEALVSLSPKDVPSADMIVQDSYPLIIHIASGINKAGLRLSALNERIGKVADEFATREGLRMGCSAERDTSQVIVVSLWRKAAEELKKARREGKLRGCVCVVPFAKKSVETLADYALHYITLETLLIGEEENEGGEVKETEREVVIVGKSSVTRRVGALAEDEGQKPLERQLQREKEEGNTEEKKERVCRYGARVTEDTILRDRILAVVRELGGVEPCAVAERLGVSLWKVSEVARELKDKELIKVAKNLPYIASLKKPNATYYLDGEKPTALHDTLMNAVWTHNIELGGRCRDFSFAYEGKTWCTDGLLENTGGSFIFEGVTSDYEERIVKQVEAYSTQIGHRGIKGIIVVALDAGCLERIRKEVAGRRISLGEGLITSLRSKDEKCQFRSLVLDGKLITYHHNSTS